eukprot:TRINITY_DN3421_c0_g1_i10.p1 TRINITY_DN3421_c0_g1~~TRINITY_DN3421_c0_g1_i10.p1  ORF type:complete len:445 (-),score=78.32 TRINITY_DN3421_c0_g1_i10:1230-2564(-)
MYSVLVVVAAFAAFYFIRRYSTVPSIASGPQTPLTTQSIYEEHTREPTTMKRSNSPTVPSNSLPEQTSQQSPVVTTEKPPEKKQRVDEEKTLTTEAPQEQVSSVPKSDHETQKSDDDEDTPKNFFDSPPPSKTLHNKSQTALVEHAPSSPPAPETTTDVPAIKAENSQDSGSESKIQIRYGLYEIQGKRKEMEDAHHAEVLNNGRAFFGVYDGHGGRRAADFLAEHLHKHLMSHPEISSNPQEAMRDAFGKTEANFMDLAYKDQLEDGSTAVVALVLGTQLFIGNIGDSEAILCRNGKAVCLSILHNPSKNPSEITRVQEAGGRLYYNRVGHPVINPVLFNIAVSRAIGDIMYKHEEWTSGKKSGLIAEPDIKVYDITSEDSFLILACDGLWDVFSYQSAVDFVKERLKETNDPQKIAEAIVQESERRDTTDNVTVCIILFDHH